MFKTFWITFATILGQIFDILDDFWLILQVILSLNTLVDSRRLRGSILGAKNGKKVVHFGGENQDVLCYFLMFCLIRFCIRFRLRF